MPTAATTPGPPTFLRVEEAADVLRTSRSTAYELANAWLRTDGACGIPAIRLGRRIVMPYAVIGRWAELGTSEAGPV
jgi:hypothetical protein